VICHIRGLSEGKKKQARPTNKINERLHAQKFAKHKEHKHKDARCSLQVLLIATANPIQRLRYRQRGHLQPHPDLLQPVLCAVVYICPNTTRSYSAVPYTHAAQPCTEVQTQTGCRGVEIQPLKCPPKTIWGNIVQS